MATATEDQYLEAVCKQLYESVDPAERASAESTLAQFSERQDCLQKCLMLLERGSSSYAQLVASTTLTKLVSKVSPVVNLEQRIELKNYLLQYMISRQSKLPQFVMAAMTQLLARLTKLGWFELTKEEEYGFRTSIDDVLKMLSGSMDMCSLGVQILCQVVAEMNLSTAVGSITKHRKIAAAFRDVYLLQIFTMVIKLLESALQSCKSGAFNDEHKLSVISNLLDLTLNCLTFDFIGSLVDDTSDDTVSVQVPSVWRSAFIDGSIIPLFYGLYANLPKDLASKALSCLVQLASIRRTVFNNSERQVFLTALLTGAKSILENPQGLTEQSTYHEFCRLVARLKSNYQLSELVKVDDYSKIARLLAEFTVESLRQYQFACNSIHYLLSFWQRMVSSMPYVKSAEPHYLEEFAPLVSKAYIDSRLSIVDAVVRDSIEDPLEDHSSLAQQLEQISVIIRCEYEKTCGILLKLFEESANLFQQTAASTPDHKICEGRLTWLVYVMGAAIGGRVAFSTSDEHDQMDGDLICRALQLMQLSDAALESRLGCEKLEHAFLWFLEQFRKIYISDQVQKTSKVYTKLTEHLGLIDETMVLSVFARKIITNLKYWSSSEKMVDETLGLLSDLSIGYHSVRKLVRLPEIQFLLNNHTAEHFTFLGRTADIKTMKCRTTFYTALTRLLAVDMAEDDTSFTTFMTPLTSEMDELVKAFSMPDSAIVGQSQIKMSVIGLARDIRGVAYASNGKTTYLMLFEWLYPQYLTVFQRSVQVWCEHADLSIAVLKLMTELCQNRSQRLQFDVVSPNAILLFKEASRMVCTYGAHTLASTAVIAKDQLYRLRLKGVSVCFSILKAALCGAFVNFGVFRLYGDTCLDDALNMFVKLMWSVERSELMAYTKLSLSYFFVMECLAQDHMNFVSNLDPPVFAYILQTLYDGLNSLENMICTGVCTTLEYILSYLYKRIRSNGKERRRAPVAGMPVEGDNCLITIDQQPDLLRQLLSSVMSAVMFEDCRCQWSMSRPLLGLILLQEDYFTSLRNQIVQSQSVDKKDAMEKAFASLMDGVERNVTLKNKDRFTQNLSVFRREVCELMKGATGINSYPFVTSAYNVDMMS